jgi:hypothetical protein
VYLLSIRNGSLFKFFAHVVDLYKRQEQTYMLSAEIFTTDQSKSKPLSQWQSILLMPAFTNKWYLNSKHTYNDVKVQLTCIHRVYSCFLQSISHNECIFKSSSIRVKQFNCPMQLFPLVHVDKNVFWNRATICLEDACNSIHKSTDAISYAMNQVNLI